ncbi:hypothetical protein NEOLEDRAFT_1150396 [Neolentinus lepideus HHB14362 ss-1]|uniref:Cytochrome P450 n=1 Tax=Neolentinus lepideus HHB14362 ss-1 TaxID=1314782 RepID=A0A165Q5V0_9AGAM|nr:hypothetical protein NEOLEDRAFT_1150396 [Neolentinus lepideus HHB14362 ss-1]
MHSIVNISSSSFVWSLLLSFIAYVVFRRQAQKYNTKFFPILSGASFLWGHELNIFRTSLGLRFSQWFKEYGPVYRIRGALFVRVCSHAKARILKEIETTQHPDILVVSDRVAINHMLTTKVYTHVKAPPARHMVELIVGRGIIWAEGEQHKRFRGYCLIHTPHASIQRLHGIWKDPDAFVPERCIEPGGLPLKEKLQIGWSNLLSFNAGPRQCIGYRLALIELKSLLFTLISNFVFDDVGAKVLPWTSVSAVPLVEGREEKGPQVPLRATFAQ